MGKCKGVFTMVRSIFLKSIIQWRFAVAVMLLQLFAVDYSQSLASDVMSGFHVFEPAGMFFMGSTGIVVSLAVVFWLSDAPFFDQWEVLVLNRTGKWKWMAVHLGYAILGCLVFTILEAVVITLLSLPYVDWLLQAHSRDFSEAASNGFWGMLQPKNSTPLWFFCTQLLMHWLGSCVFVLIMFAVNMRYSRSYGLCIAVLMWGFSEFMGIMGVNTPMQALLMPTNNMTLHNFISRIAAATGVGVPPLWMGIACNVGYIVILIAVILLLTPGYPFPFVKSRQGRTTD